MMMAHRRGAGALALLLLAATASATSRTEIDNRSKRWVPYAPRLNEYATYHYGRWVLPDLIDTANNLMSPNVEKRKTEVIPSWMSCPNSGYDTFPDEAINYLGKLCTNRDEYLFRNDPHVTITGYHLKELEIIYDENNIRTEKQKYGHTYEVWELTPDENNIGGTRFTGRYASTLRKIFPINGWPLAESKIFPSSIAFLNGVSTTYHGAKITLSKIEAEFGKEYKDTALKYDLLHNQTYCGGNSGMGCIADLAEVFEQRQNELDSSLKNRWEIFWDTLSGRHEDPSSTTGALVYEIGGAFADLTISLDAAIKNKAIQLTTSIFKQPIRQQDLANHLSILEANATKNISTTIIAHSQGNLFANEIRSRYPQTSSIPPIYFVHVAPPAKTLAGKYLLSDKDAIINGLGLLIKDSTLPPNIAMPITTGDKSGHGFIETYWNKGRPALKALIAETLDLH